MLPQSNLLEVAKNPAAFLAQGDFLSENVATSSTGLTSADTKRTFTYNNVALPPFSTHALALQIGGGNQKAVRKMRQATLLVNPKPPLLNKDKTGEDAFVLLRPRFRDRVSWQKCIVYRNLWARNYYIRHGVKFGAHFLVYKGDPRTHHSSFMVQVVGAGESMTGTELNAQVRMACSIKKLLVFASVQDTEQQRDIGRLLEPIKGGIAPSMLKPLTSYLTVDFKSDSSLGCDT